jgi:iron complex outermembrane receptor protein
VTLLTTSLFAIEIPSVIIESSKLDESALDTAQTVELIDQNKVAIFHIKDVKELSSTIANANISGIGSRTNRTFTIRGISNYVSFESSVAMYIDDAPVPFSFGYGALDMNNIANIEVLKGPQGTQFGKGAESAVLNVYTKPTTKRFQGEASIDLGTYNTRDFYGRLSGPIGDTDFSYAFSVSNSSHDGYSENVLTGNKIDDREQTSLSAKFRYNPSSPWDIALNYTKNRADDGGSAFKVDTKENPYVIDDKPYDDQSKMDNDLLSFVIKYKENDYTFTSATTYAKQAVLKKSYVDSSGGLLIDLDVAIKELTQEVRLKYSFEKAELLVGAFYSNKVAFDYKENIYSYFYNTSSTNTLQNPDKDIALFTEMKYWFDEHYAMTAGVRFQETKRSFNRNLNQFFQPAVEAESSKTWTHLLPTLSFSYYANDSAHTYLRYAKGYRPGGYNYRAPEVNLVPFEPEVTESFELGHKQNFSASFALRGTLFYNDITDQRTVIFDNNLATTTLNANKAYSCGAELDLSYQTETFLLYTTLGVVRAKFKEFDKDAGAYDGNHLVDVPDMTAAVGATYHFNHSWFIQPSARYMGKRYYDIENTQEEGGYTTADLGLGYEDRKGLKVLVYATNLSDEANVDFEIHTQSHNYYHFTDPRVLGVKVSKNF